MTVEALAAASSIANPLPVADPSAMAMPAAAQPVQPAGDSFGQLVSDGLNQVNQELLASQGDLQSLAVGNAQNLHQIMMRLEESRLSLQLLMQTRTRLLEAYQDVMKMQV